MRRHHTKHTFHINDPTTFQFLFFTRNDSPNLFIHDFNYGSEASIPNSSSPTLMSFNTGTPVSSSNMELNPTTCAVELGGGFSNNPMSEVEGLLHGSGTSNSLFFNLQANVLESPKVPTPTAQLLHPSRQQPTMYQDWADLRQGNTNTNKLGALEIRATTRLATMNELERKRKMPEVVEAEKWLNYDSDDDIIETEKLMEYQKTGGICFKANNNNENDNNDVINISGMQKRKGNIMAERRRRKKLNDKLYTLRSVVPEISKMDKASIIRDAIEYLKDVSKKVDDIKKEMESAENSPASSSLTPISQSQQTPTLPTLPSSIKDERCPPRPTSLVSNESHHYPPKVEVRVREGGVINIHIFCPLKSFLFASVIKALDSIGIDLELGVLSCYNGGFAFDVFRAEQYKGQALTANQIKAVLMKVAGLNGTM